MRNIQKYPVTLDEKIEAVRHAMDQALKQGGIGSIRPVALSLVLEELEAKKAAEQSALVPPEGC